MPTIGTITFPIVISFLFSPFFCLPGFLFFSPEEIRTSGRKLSFQYLTAYRKIRHNEKFSERHKAVVNIFLRGRFFLRHLNISLCRICRYALRYVRDFAKRLWMWDKCGYAPTELLGFDPGCEIAESLFHRFLGRSDKLRDILPVSLICLYVITPYGCNVFFYFFFYFILLRKRGDSYIPKKRSFSLPRKRGSVYLGKEDPFISEKRGFILALRRGFVRLYS